MAAGFVSAHSPSIAAACLQQVRPAHADAAKGPLGAAEARAEDVLVGGPPAVPRGEGEGREALAVEAVQAGAAALLAHQPVDDVEAVVEHLAVIIR